MNTNELRLWTPSGIPPEMLEDFESRRDMILGRRLGAIRERAHVTLDDLSAFTGIPVAGLRAHENGTDPFPLTRVRPIAWAFDLSPRALFDLLDSPLS